jgi:O-antigen ligase
MSPGNRSVILAGMAAFVISGALHNVRRPSGIYLGVFWALWLANAAIVAVENRGGLLAILLALTVLITIRPSIEWLRLGAIATLAFVVLFAANPEVDLGSNRVISARQFTANVTSIFSDDTSNVGSVQDTKEWRLEFWSEIYQDTVEGEHFWRGLGFGENLANYYGFQLKEDDSLRSPHNSHVTILGRMGVPGFVVWILLQLGFAALMLRGSIRWRHSRGSLYSYIYLMILSMWTAMTVEACFDVYYESPQGGIWMWSLVGVGLAVRRIESGEPRQQDGQKEAPQQLAAPRSASAPIDVIGAIQ